MPSLKRIRKKVLGKLDNLLPEPTALPDWEKDHLLEWRPNSVSGQLVALPLSPIEQSLPLAAISHQVTMVRRNTIQHLESFPANNVLISGARGSGKTTIVRQLAHQYGPRGLRVVMVPSKYLNAINTVLQIISDLPFRFILLLDDISIQMADNDHTVLKNALDLVSNNPFSPVLFYATSNRRNLVSESFGEREVNSKLKTEVHPHEAYDEKLSLADRFGINVSLFHQEKDSYLSMVNVWLETLINQLPSTLDNNQKPSMVQKGWEKEALAWSRRNGSLSGRTAMQFARDYVGKLSMEKKFGDGESGL